MAVIIRKPRAGALLGVTQSLLKKTAVMLYAFSKRSAYKNVYSADNKKTFLLSETPQRQENNPLNGDFWA